MIFQVNIELGDDAMQNGDDIAEALTHVVDRLGEGYEAGPILDRNGNTVGGYSFSEEPA